MIHIGLSAAAVVTAGQAWLLFCERGRTAAYRVCVAGLAVLTAAAMIQEVM
jgi:hypothetical protein